MVAARHHDSSSSTWTRSHNRRWLVYCNLLLILLLSQIFHLCHSFSIQPHRPTKGSSSSSYNKKNTLLKYRQDDARTTTTTEELRRDIALIATHPEQKIQISADSVIGGSINVTKIEFLDHDDNKRNGKRVEPAEESEDSGDGDDNADGTAGSSANHPTPLATIRSMWRRRNARTAEEGIRREKAVQLSNILAKANDIEAAPSRRYGARTIMGLIHALAEEVDDLNVEVDARRDTPLWGKQIDAIRIKFSRLGFKPLRMGGLDQAFHEYKTKFPDTEQGAFHMDKQLYDLSSADEAFDRIDVDNSGALDRDEIAEALATAARSSDETEHRKLREGLKGLADELVALYDFNGDGVVDRYEYRTMVEDMAALQENQESERQEEEDRLRSESAKSEGGWMETIKGFVLGLLFRKRNDVLPETVNGDVNATTNSQSSDSAITTRGDDLTSAAPNLGDDNKEAQDHRGGLVFDGMQPTGVIRRISTVTDEQINSLMSKDLGSITISDLKIDLRRLLFGAIPFVKHIVPGGPLVLEPFTVTITASFNSQDIKNSFLLDAGLRRLVAQAIRRRVRSLRDMLDGAVFYGRSWKMSSKSAPIVDVIAIEDVQFDTLGRLILTGRVRVQTTPDQPVVENAFKLRARLGTNASGRRIRLVEPELALVLECPTLWESVLRQVCDVLNVPERERPKPLYFFFPISSPFRKTENPENDGFDLGEDNQIKSIYIKDSALRFELSAVLRPGRFLGNHYLAFTVPNRTFIITLDRVKEGIRAARKTKQAAKAVSEAALHTRHLTTNDFQKLRQTQVKRVQPKSFFSRFVDGYIQAERGETGNERVTKSIRDFFGRQSARVNRKMMSNFRDDSTDFKDDVNGDDDK